MGIEHLGVGPSVLIGAAICVAGLVVTHLWAPETTDLSLTKAQEATPPGDSSDPAS